MRVQEPTTELCPERLCGGTARDRMGERLGSLAEDLSVVSLHLLLPEGLRSDLPAVDRTFADFRGGGRDDAARRRASGNGSFSPKFRRSRTSTVDDLVAGIRPEPGRAGLSFPPRRLPPCSLAVPAVRAAVPVREGRTRPGLEDEQWSEQAFPRAAGDAATSAAGRLYGPLGRTNRWIGCAGLACSIARIVIFTADHGVSFRPGASRRAITRHETGATSPQCRCSSSTRARGAAGSTRSMVRNVDIVPTIAEELGDAAALGGGRAADPRRGSAERPGRGLRPAFGRLRQAPLHRLRPRAGCRPRAHAPASSARTTAARACTRPGPTATCWGSRGSGSRSAADPPAACRPGQYRVAGELPARRADGAELRDRHDRGRRSATGVGWRSP